MHPTVTTHCSMSINKCVFLDHQTHQWCLVLGNDQPPQWNCLSWEVDPSSLSEFFRHLLTPVVDPTVKMPLSLIRVFVHSVCICPKMTDRGFHAFQDTFACVCNDGHDICSRAQMFIAITTISHLDSTVTLTLEESHVSQIISKAASTGSITMTTEAFSKIKHILQAPQKLWSSNCS